MSHRQRPHFKAQLGRVPFQAHVVVGRIYIFDCQTQGLSFRRAVSWRPSLVTGGCPRPQVLGLPHGPPQMPLLYESQQGGESPCKVAVTVLCDVIMEVNSITLAVFYRL